MSMTVEQVWHRYPKAHAWVLQNICLRIESGQTVALMGPSGSGKTTLLSIVGGLLHPTMGLARSNVDQDGSPGRGGGPRFGWIFQTVNALGHRTAVDNVALALLAHGDHHAHARAVAWGALDTVGLAHLAQRPVQSLSGGERQRVCVVRALAPGPDVVLADEPTAQLDRANADRLVETLITLKPQHTTVVMATHDPLVARAADRVIELVSGHAFDR